VLVVCDAYRLAPWADVLVAQDSQWWRKRPDACTFAGRKFSANPNVPCVEQIKENSTLIGRATNSGVMGLHVAIKLGAKRIIMLGFDMQGSHFFGPYTDGLKNTTAARFRVFASFFERMNKDICVPQGIQVVNCTPGTALKCFPMMPLEEALCPA
jgi:hypothetical protein